MTTIREFFTDEASDQEFDDEQYSDDYVNVEWMLEQFGIDPDLPAEWATVDRCLTWLRERGYWYHAHDGWWTDDVMGHKVEAWVPDGGLEQTATGPTLHAALVAACKAVQEAS